MNSPTVYYESSKLGKIGILNSSALMMFVNPETNFHIPIAVAIRRNRPNGVKRLDQERQTVLGTNNKRISQEPLVSSHLEDHVTGVWSLAPPLPLYG